MKNGLIFGILAGALYMTWIVIGDHVAPNLVYRPIPSIIISSLLIVAFMILACRKEKAALDGSIRFGEAFLVCMVAYTVFNFLYAIGFKLYVEASSAAMTNFIEITKASTADIMTKMGNSEDEIFQAMEGMERTLPTIFSWKTTVLNAFGTIIFPGGILALITAGLISKFSKNQPTV